MRPITVRPLSSRAAADMQNAQIRKGSVHTGTGAEKRQIGGSARGYHELRTSLGA
jgi:hypothetical protein